jgi:hypothetical protein
MSDFVPSGHFYSPVINLDDTRIAESRIWPERPLVLGIDFNDLSHQYLLTEIFPKYLKDYDYVFSSEDRNQECEFYHNNPQFGWLDSKTLFVFLRMLKPRKMIEIGSGFSSLLTADVNRRFLDRGLEFTCIEPYPPDFLLKDVSGINQLIRRKVENLPLSVFGSLERGDVLFVDSSHVSKTGNDVNYIYFEIIPRLQPGVVIHIHDIFLPSDYPKEWVLNEKRSWNEQYLVRALLMFTHTFEVVFGCWYAAYYAHAELVKKALGGELYGGGSLWIRKTS